MRIVIVIVMSLGLLSSYAFGADGCTAAKKKAVCTDDIVKEKTKWAADLVKAKGKDSTAEIKKLRYDCCGEPDYIWINTCDPVKMVMHPIKPMLDRKDVTGNKDPDGKAIFVEFCKAAKASSDGCAWVDYKWTKFGDKDPTDKKSWVCLVPAGTTNAKWLVDSGTWK